MTSLMLGITLMMAMGIGYHGSDGLYGFDVFGGSDEIEIDLEGKARGLVWLPPHHPLHMEQI